MSEDNAEVEKKVQFTHTHKKDVFGKSRVCMDCGQNFSHDYHTDLYLTNKNN